jgi:mono/diheme cytochrome c family protein
MILFLLTALSIAGQPTKRLPDAERGGELYMQNCWMCHGRKGQGNGPAAAAFKTESPAIAKKSEESREKMIRVILDGRNDMPAFNAVMDRADANRVLIWLEDPKAVKATVKKKGPVKKPAPKRVPASKGNGSKGSSASGNKKSE